MNPVGTFVNADLTAKLLAPAHPEAVSFAAGRLVIRQLDVLIRDRTSFVYETTISGSQPLDIMRRAKAAGFKIGFVFVILSTVELNIERVSQRVAQGGHDIPQAVIRRRYGKAFENLPMAFSLADEVIVLENTDLKPQVILSLASKIVVEDRLRSGDPVHDMIACALLAA